MVEKRITASNNVVELANYQRGRTGTFLGYAMSPRTCRYCGAELEEDEREDDCSSALNVESARLRWRAAQILRGLVCEG
jgi:predicted nucleic acid-binding Zn ribbon protein